VEQQPLSDFSVTKCILAEPTATSSCGDQLEKNANNNNILPSEVKQEGDSTVSGESYRDHYAQYNSNIMASWLSAQ